MIANTQIPLVSFIITTYNLPLEYLVECLKSILQLSLNSREREIILVDDGSDISPINDLVEYQDDIIYIHSGYLIFDLHPELPFILDVIKDFYDHHVVILPQTVNILGGVVSAYRIACVQ